MRHSLLLLFLLSSLQAFSEKNYFQQQTDFQIEVSLDDKHHILRGFETIQYTNNSPDTLRYLFFHLWPNGYKNDRTAFTEQQVENGKTAFYFSKEEDHGFIDSLHFLVNNEEVNLSNFNNYEDVVLLELPSPLYPGKRIEITTPFRVVLPAVFSRLGHIDQDYQICQWYPKPAVYDKQGWHPMPYLDQGEFYSEFGNYQVRISLPASYWVAATGILQTSSEQEAIRKKMEQTQELNENESAFKTIEFKQDHIHDFAWFASKDYLISKSEIKLDSRSIACYSYFKPQQKLLYEKANEITAKTIQYLSEHVGEYPYDQVSVVQGVTSDIAGGMEYPMLAHVGKVKGEDELRTVIVHEVGHNWFYGILGNNERDFAWMDEGINSFYEREIVAWMHAENNTDLTIDLGTKIGKTLNHHFLFDLASQQHTDQAIEIPSSHFTELNYGAMIYAKFPIQFSYLRSYLGQTVFEQCMKRYYTDWKFKHPQPEDIRAIFEQSTNKDLSWFFDAVVKTTTPIDFKIKRVVQGNVFVTSKNNFKGPIPVSAFQNKNLLKTEWVEYPYQLPANFSGIAADIYRISFDSVWHDTNPRNSFYKTSGLFKRYALKAHIGGSLGLKEKHQVSFLPAIGYNYYNRFMTGIVLHNLRIPNQSFQYAFVPMYSFGAKQFVGTGFVAYTLFPKQRFQKITLGVQAKSFHHNQSSLNTTTAVFTRYAKINPFVQVEWKPSFARSSVKRQMEFAVFSIRNESLRYNLSSADSLYRPAVAPGMWQHFAYARYQHRNQRTFNPFDYEVDAVGNADFLKLRLTANLKVDYHYLNKAFYVRFFAGKFFNFGDEKNSFLLRDQWLNGTYGASNDFLYNQTYLARNEQDHWMAKQIAMNEGGMKIRSSFLANPIGINDNWLTAINLRSDLPIKSKMKLQLFLDVATYSNAGSLNNSGNKVIYDAGVEWHLFNDLLVFYLPLLNSKDYKDYLRSTYPKNRLLQSVTFSLNLHKYNWLSTQQALTRFMN